MNGIPSRKPVTADDLRDGFIHLSTEEQVDGVIERYFSGQHPLYTAEFSGLNFLQILKWEISASAVSTRICMVLISCQVKSQILLNYKLTKPISFV